MFGKRSKNHSVFKAEKHRIQKTSMYKLQQLTSLQSDLMAILGRKNISIDQDNDIFTRLQELYSNYLQNQTLGLNLVQKFLIIFGDSDFPIRVNFLYYFAHEIKLKGAALDEIEPVLLNCCESNLNLKNKLQLGFKSGLVFCQISQHLFDTIKVVNNLIVTLEEELNEKCRQSQRLLKSKSVNPNRLRVQNLKSVYIGSNIVLKNPLKLPRRIELTLYLYQAYLTLMTKVESETKKQYYSSRMSDIKRRLMRQYPGYNIQNRLSYIEHYKYVALKQFNEVIGVNDFSQHCEKDKAKTEPNSFISRKMFQKEGHLKTFGQNHLNINFSETLKNSFVRQAKSSKPKAPLKLNMANTQLMASKVKNNILQLKSRSKSKLQKKSSPYIQFQAKFTQKAKQYQKDHISRSKFVQNADNKKGFILKFEKRKEKENGKEEVKKKKIKLHLHWQEKPQNQRYKIVAQSIKQNNEYTQRIESKIETKLQLPKNIDKIQQHPQLKIFARTPSPTIRQKIQINTVNLSLQQSLLDIEEAGKQNLQLQHNQNCQQILARHTQSNEEIDNCQSRIDQKNLSQHDSFSQTYQLNSVNELINIRSIEQQIEEKEEKEDSYKIIVSKKTIDNIKRQDQLVCSKNTLKQGNTIQECIQENQELMNIFKEEIDIMIGDISKQICINLIPIDQSMQKAQYLILQERCNQVYMGNEIQSNTQAASTAQKSSLFQKIQCKQDTNCTPNHQILIHLNNFQQQNNQKQQPDTLDIIDSWLNNIKVKIQINQSLMDDTQQEYNKQIEQYVRDLYTSIELFTIIQLDGSISLMDSYVINIKDDQKQTKIANAFKKQVNRYQDQNQKIESDYSIQYNAKHEFLIMNIPLTSLDTSNEPCSKLLPSATDANQNSPTDFKSQSNVFKDLLTKDNEKQEHTSYNYLNMPTSNQKQYEILYDNINQKAMSAEIQRKKIETSRPQYIQKSSQIINPVYQQDNDDKIFSSQTDRKDKNEIHKHKGLNHLLISFSYNQNDTITELEQQIQHWLNPHIKITNKATIVTIYLPKSSIIYEKKYQIETSNCLKDSLLKKITRKLEQFLQRYSEDDYKSMNSSLWNKIIEDLQDLNLLPDSVDFKIIKLEDKIKGIICQITFQLKIKDNIVTFQCKDNKIHYYPIDVAKNGDIEKLKELISPQNIFINHNELIFKGIWTLVGQRNIKFKDKYQQKTTYYTFNIYQNCSKGQPMRFDYCVQNSNGNLSMKFNFDGLDIRQKVIKNIETIIGYCLKQINTQVVIFDDSGIENFLKLL